MKKLGFILSAFLLTVSLISYGQVPGTLSYQGILMQSDGITPITDGAHSIVFSFYTGATGGSALFSRTISVTTTKGLYTCIIGGGGGANTVFSATEMNQIGSQQVYIGVALDGGSELLPRAQLTTAPYVIRAQAVTQTANTTGGNVAFWGTNNTLGTDNGLYWDNANKKLGIGTTSPSTNLRVAGTMSSSGSISSDGIIYSAGLNSSGLAYMGNNMQVWGSASPSAPDASAGSESMFYLRREATAGVKNSNTAEIKLSTFENGIIGRTSLEFWLSGIPNAENNSGTVGEVPVLILHGDDGAGTDNRGKVGIGTQSPNATLSVNGDATKVGGGTWGSFSDIRLKTDVKDFTDGLEVLKKINPKTFRYNGLGEIRKSTKDEIGIIAQEVQPVAPYMINVVPTKLHPGDKEKTDLLMFDGGNSLLFVLVNSVKEQQTEIDALKKEVAEMKRLLEQVKATNTTISTGR